MRRGEEIGPNRRVIVSRGAHTRASMSIGRCRRRSLGFASLTPTYQAAKPDRPLGVVPTLAPIETTAAGVAMRGGQAPRYHRL